MFTQEQLDLIRFYARKTKNQGELAVLNRLFIHDQAYQEEEITFTGQELAIVQYCAEECKRQRSGEMSVYNMINAWNYAINHFNGQEYPPISLNFIEDIGRIVEPIDNAKGFRTIPIGVTDGFGGWIEKSDWRDVPRLLTILLESYYEGNLCSNGGILVVTLPFVGLNEKSERAEDQFYYEYENIHPFVDGNGRSGKILYNYLCGTLENPIMPPNFWGGSNP